MNHTSKNLVRSFHLSISLTNLSFAKKSMAPKPIWRINMAEQRAKRKATDPPSPPRGRFESSEAYIRYSTLITERDILPERGFITSPGAFSQYPSVIKEKLENRGWVRYATHPDVIYPKVVREVYANIPLAPTDGVYFRGKTVAMTAQAINELLELREIEDCHFEALRKGGMTEEVYSNISQCICIKGTKWEDTTKKSKHLMFEDLLPEAKVWYHFVAASLCPTRYAAIVTEEIAALLYCIVNEFPINVGRIIARKIRTNRNRHTDMIFPAVIGGLMRGNFERSLEEWEPVARKLNPNLVRGMMELGAARIEKKREEKNGSSNRETLKP